MNLVAVADAIAWSALLLVARRPRPCSRCSRSCEPRRGLRLVRGGHPRHRDDGRRLDLARRPSSASRRSSTVLGFTAAVFGGSPLPRRRSTSRWAAPSRPACTAASSSPNGRRPRSERQGVVAGARREVLRGGLTIGVLERVATAGAIIAGFPEGSRSSWPSRASAGSPSSRPPRRASGSSSARSRASSGRARPRSSCTSPCADRASAPARARPSDVAQPCAQSATWRGAGTARRPGSPGIQNRHGNAAPPPAPLTPVRGPVANAHRRASGTSSANGGASRSAPLAASGTPSATASRAGPAREVAIGCRRPGDARASSSPSTHRRRRAAAPPTTSPGRPATTLRHVCMP